MSALLAFGPLLLKLFGGFWKGLVALVRWMIEHPVHTAFFALAGVCAFLVLQNGSLRADLRQRDKQLANEVEAHRQTAANFRKASEEATRAAEANVARVKSDQQRITEDVIQDYRTRVAAVRARAERLRSGTPATNPGGSNATGVPRVPGTPGGPDEAAGENGLPPADALIATEQAIQLDELQKWVRRQSQVNNTEVPQ